MKRTNEKYNHWTIISVDEHGSRKHQKQCICRCDCGRLYKRDYFKLKYGLVAQCRECKYRAYICIHRKTYNLGEYNTVEQAAQARHDFIKNNNLTEYNE